ncbi:membrane metallo-endopeptidase-like 1 isoform X3 [Rhipicephalus microplus]
MYGAKPPLDKQLALKIQRYENRLQAIEVTTITPFEDLTYTPFEKLGESTKPYVTANEWITFFYKYTNGTYTEYDSVMSRPYAIAIIVKLFKSMSVGLKGLRYLVAWTFYRQLVEVTDQYYFLRGKPASDVCYQHVKDVMNLAILTHYFHTVVSPRMVYQTKRMVSRIRNAFANQLNSSSWVSREIAADAIDTLNGITAYVGSAGRRLDGEFVEAIYKPYPNVPLDRYFPTWIKAFSHSAHYFWIDKATPLYREDEVNAYYTPEEETLTVPTGIMCGPVLYPFVPLAINYGGLGMVIGHEFMRAFDLNNIKISYWTEDFRKDYTEKALCLRRSHKSVLTTTQQNVLDDIVDSENIADFVGTRTAYEAFASLPEKYKSVKLVGFNMTSDQLFFINHCVKWCAEHDIIGKLYERFRSRCIVPLRNMPEFSEAFGCSEETRMNPPRKCNFW